MAPEINIIRYDSEKTLFSILIPSIPERKNMFLPRLLDKLKPQLMNNPAEICILSDDRTLSIGEKRNQLLDMAQGKYIAYIDDDDIVTDDYVLQILSKASSEADVIVFDVWVTINGQQGKICKYGVEYQHKNEVEGYYRLPNHLMVHKKENVSAIRFKEINFGEDDEWAARVKPTITSQQRIKRTLYFYEYSSITSRSNNKKLNRR